MNNKQWYEATCVSEQNEAQMISDFFQACDALSVTFTDGSVNQGDERFANEPTHDTQLWPQTRITALYDNQTACKEAIQTITDYVPHCPTIDFQILEEKNWVHEGQKNFPAKVYGMKQNLWVYPSWDDTYLNQVSPSAFIRLDPGLAFGTGTHPTTHLCLEWLANHTITDQTVFDFGCGSGILSIAALALGAKHVIAIDHDPQAIIASKQNRDLNQTIDTSKLAVSLDWPNEQFDLVLANVLANPLISFANKLSAALKPNAILVLSGILKDEESAILQAYKDLKHIETLEHDGWLLISFSLC